MSKIRWLGLHVFYHDLNRFDHLLVTGVYPILDELKIERDVRKYFFIRYWEGGPHIRIRILAQENNVTKTKAVVEQKLISYFKKYPSRVSFDDPQKYYNQLNEQGGELYNNHTIKEFKYNPEYQRYGGQCAMSIAQSYFHLSSDVALNVIKAYMDKRNKLYSIAMDMMLLTTCAFFSVNSHLIEFFKGYSNYFKVYNIREMNDKELFSKWNNSFNKQTHQLKRQMQLLISSIIQRETEQLPALYKHWFSESVKLCTELDRLYKDQLLYHPINGDKLNPINDAEKLEAYVYYVQSYIHMHNNRLGINPIEESYLAYLLYRTLLILIANKESMSN